MLSVNMNRDVEQYQEAVMFGLNGKQTIAVILALTVGVGTTCALYFGIGLSMEVSIYTALPLCVPIVLPALGKTHGLTVTEQIWQSNKRKKILMYHSIPMNEMQKRGKETSERRGVENGKEKKSGWAKRALSKNKKQI